MPNAQCQKRGKYLLGRILMHEDVLVLCTRFNEMLAYSIQSETLPRRKTGISNTIENNEIKIQCTINRQPGCTWQNYSTMNKWLHISHRRISLLFECTGPSWKKKRKEKSTENGVYPEAKRIRKAIKGEGHRLNSVKWTLKVPEWSEWDLLLLRWLNIG